MANIGTAKVTTFGVEDVKIKLPVTSYVNGDSEWIDIPAVTAASFKGSVSEVEIYGDDVYQDTWYHSQKGQLNVKCSKAAMRVFELLTGNDAVSSAGSTTEKIQIMEDSQLTPPDVAVKCTMKARTDSGAVAKVTAIFYRCRVRTTFESFPDGAHGKAGEVTLMFDVQRSEKDEYNTNNAYTLPSGKAAFGRIELPNT